MMGRGGTLVAVVAFILLTGSSAAPGPDHGKAIGLVRGVVFSASGSCLEGVSVRCVRMSIMMNCQSILWKAGEGLCEGRTDSSGGFILQVPYQHGPTSSIGVLAEAPGYSSAARLVCFDLVKSRGNVAIAFTLERAAESGGEVKGREGRVVAGARVCLWPLNCGPTPCPNRMPRSHWWKYSDGTLYIVPGTGGLLQRESDALYEMGMVHIAETNGRGEFRFGGLAERAVYYEAVWAQEEGERTAGDIVFAGRNASIGYPDK